MILRIGDGQPAHERGNGDDLVAGGQLRVLEQVDDLDLVARIEVLLAEPHEVGERPQRFRD